MDLDTLKNETLNLIDQYNRDEAHRRVTPINGYGDPSGTIRLYWALWSDNQHSTYQIGFMYHNDQLHPMGSNKSIPLEQAIDNFKIQLEDIPSR